MAVDVEELVPAGPLGAYLDEVLDDGRGEPLAVSRIGEGRSNLTFRVDRGGHAWVLRRPPLGDLPETAHDMGREYRVLAGLATTAVRAPRPLVTCPDPAVIGVPFYLMEVVDGVVIRATLPSAFEADVAARAALGHELIDALTELHLADYQAAGLGDLGKPEGYTARQVTRWTKQWGVMATRELPDVDAVRDWLTAHLPTSAQTTLVHGDYKMDNVVYAPEPPAQLRAILDWEMCTLGDPLADLGYLLVFWPEAGDPPLANLTPPTAQPGFPSRAELVARYEAITGFAMTDLTFYRTLALWKLAILSEGLYKRYLAGKSDSDWPAILEFAVPEMAARARGWCGA